MRLLVNALSARRGGILTYTRNLLSSLVERGLDITIAVPDEFADNEMENVRTFNIIRFSPLHRFAWEQIYWRKFVRDHSPDVLFSSANFGLLNSPVKQILLLREGGLFDPFYLANMTAVQGVGSAFNRYFRRRLMLMSARSASHIITPTSAMRDAVTLWEPSINEKCTVNPYGTINDAFRPSQEPRPWRAGGILKLLYVSVYYPHKVPNLVCQAVDLLNSRGIQAHATITMSQDEFTDTRGSALDDNVLLDAQKRGIVTLGPHKYANLPQLYRDHDVFVFPSVSETFGHPMAEAMSTGLPVVASDTLVNHEICGEAALYFKPFSAGELADQIEELNNAEALRNRLSAEGRHRAISRYSWEDHVDRLVDTFEAATSLR